MEMLKAIGLGLIQGFTEFLPVSSSGHLVLFQKLFGFQEHDIAFDVIVHIGTLLSVLTVYRSSIREILIDCTKKEKILSISGGVRTSLLILVATLPTAVIGLSFKDFFESAFSSLPFVGGCFLFTGALLWITKWKSTREEGGLQITLNNMAQISLWQALIIGIAQGAAIAPGVSRSGMTIAVALLLGVSRGSAAQFSFLLAIPAIVGAAILQLPNVEWTTAQALNLSAGLISSYFFGLIGLIGLLRVVKRGRLEIFSFYLWPLGIFAIWI